MSPKEEICTKIDIICQNHFLQDIPSEWSNFEAIICDPIQVNTVKKAKLIKRGFKSLIKNPSAFFSRDKQTIRLHFDMHHGYGNLSKAIDVMDYEDREDFRNFVNTSTSFNPHIIFITKPKIANKWFKNLFSWLFNCEEIFGFKNLKGYDTERLYAYLAERYLSFWFNKHTKVLNWPWILFEPYKIIKRGSKNVGVIGLASVYTAEGVLVSDPFQYHL